MGVQAVFAILLLLVPTVKTEPPEGDVTFWREHFTMTCPGEGTWHRDDKEINSSKIKQMERKYGSDTRGSYYCKYNTEGAAGEKTYYFYVKGRVCDNCFELDSMWFAVAIVADVIGTVALMYIIYKFTSKKGSHGPTQPPRATPNRPAGRGPPVPPTDYEQLNTQTRNADTYSTINKMG